MSRNIRAGVATFLACVALMTLAGILSAQVGEVYEASGSVYWDDPALPPASGYLTLSTAIVEDNGEPVQWLVLLNDEIIYSQPITPGTTNLPIPQYYIQGTWRISQDGEVISEETFTTTVGAAPEVGNGEFAGPFLAQWNTASYEGLVNVALKLEWAADNDGVTWPSVTMICPGKVQGADGFCLWGVFEGSLQVLFLPVVMR